MNGSGSAAATFNVGSAHFLDTSAVIAMMRQRRVAGSGALLPFATVAELSIGGFRAADRAKEWRRIDVRRPTSVVVGVLADGTYRVGCTLITSVDLPVAIRVLAGLPDKPEIILKADKDAPFAQVMSMLDACRNAGLTNVAALTTPAKARN